MTIEQAIQIYDITLRYLASGNELEPLELAIYRKAIDRITDHFSITDKDVQECEDEVRNG